MLADWFQTAIIENVVVSERMKVYEASFEFKIENAPKYYSFWNIIHSIPLRDKITIILQDNTERFYEFSAANIDSYEKFIGETLEEEYIDVKIRIEKDVVDNHFSIYSYDNFVNDILSLSIEEVMLAFSGLLNKARNYLIFDVLDQAIMFATKTMFFLPYGNGMINPEFNRLQRMEECKEVSYFYNFDTYEVLPDDFKITIDYENNPLTEVFRKISSLLSVSFIATSSTISGRRIKGIINGQRSMEYSCEINKLSGNKVLYSIYNWIYTDGNPIDKAIIARNVISLHCKYIPITEIDDKVMASIQSNYNLYLKDNVKEYLELKNKVAEFITETVSKTGEYAMSLLEKFKSNLIAIFGFMFTVILANIVSDQPLDNLFTKEITILVECVLVGSFVYLLICYVQSKYEIGKVYESYGQLKQNYKEILTEEDLSEIFEGDRIFNEMKNTIKHSQKLYLSMWIAFLIIAILVVEMLSNHPTYHNIIQLLDKVMEILRMYIQ